jgi:hypothetical protein
LWVILLASPGINLIAHGFDQIGFSIAQYPTPSTANPMPAETNMI